MTSTGSAGSSATTRFHGRTDPAIIRDLADLWGAGEPDALIGRLNGGTQPQIVHDVAVRLGTPEEVIDAHLEACLARYVELLEEEVADGRVEVLPGIKELVTALAADRRVRRSACSRATSRRAHVSSSRPPASCRSSRSAPSAPTRRCAADLPPVAVRRAEELTGRRFAGKEIVVIGDTPADIECGAPLGVKADRRGDRQAHRGRAGRTRAGSPLRRLRATGAPCTRPCWPERRAAAGRSEPRPAAAPIAVYSQPKRDGESGARSSDGVAPPASSATSRPVTGREREAQHAVARGQDDVAVPRRAPDDRQAVGRHGPRPAPDLSHGPVRGDMPKARSAPRRSHCDALAAGRACPSRRARVCCRGAARSPSGVSTTCASPR